jgi:hypothetical protein
MPDDDDQRLRGMVTSVVGDLLDRVARSVRAEAAPGSAAGLSRPERLGWNCSGPEFTCGEYHCTATVGCSQIFRCTVSFTGYSRTF